MTNKTDTPNEIKSHIQMPKLMLKRFHNQNNKFFYYDVVNQFIGNNGTAKSTNTELGYYSTTTENYFRDKIETPFGDILSYVDKIDFTKESLTVSAHIVPVIKDFLYALIARSPSFMKQMTSDDSLFQLLPTQNCHDYITRTGIQIAKQNKIFSDYIVTFLINNTNVPYVLSVNGLYSYVLNGHGIVNLPISPQVAITLINKSYASKILNEDASVSMFVISEPNIIMKMNSCAFSTQVKHKWGCVICPEKGELERLWQEHNNEPSPH